MSSINPHYTFNYSQPTEYRFSHDSVFLARKVFELNQAKLAQNIRGLDLCAGCGIIGLDFVFHYLKNIRTERPPLSFDFLEVQEIYHPHFAENERRLREVFPGASLSLNFLNLNYAKLLNAEYAGRYDLIVSNPPYFFPEKGTLSPSEFKNRCRFFIDAGFRDLLLGIANALSDQGKAYVLLRDLSDQKWNALEESRNILREIMHVNRIGDIRGTHLVCLEKKI